MYACKHISYTNLYLLTNLVETSCTYVLNPLDNSRIGLKALKLISKRCNQSFIRTANAHILVVNFRCCKVNERMDFILFKYLYTCVFLQSTNMKIRNFNANDPGNHSSINRHVVFIND